MELAHPVHHPQFNAPGSEVQISHHSFYRLVSGEGGVILLVSRRTLHGHPAVIFEHPISVNGFRVHGLLGRTGPHTRSVFL
jgi:hypothetical protein